MGHNIATNFLPRSYCQTYSGYPRVGFCLSTGRCTGASSTRHRCFPGAKGARLHFFNTVAAEFTDLNPVDYGFWSVLLKKVYRSTIANVSELDMAYSFYQQKGTLCPVDRGCCYRPVAPSSQRLCPWSGAHFEHQA